MESQRKLCDKDPLCIWHSWRAFQQTMGTEIKLSIAYHPQTIGQSEKTI